MNPKEELQVLIVEDDILVTELLQSLLHEIGYAVIGQAIDGTEAVEMAKSLRPDVILMDIEMPGTNGLEAMRTISELCPTPVVVVTAYETPELVSQAGAAGAGAYLIKPPNSHEMERAITIARARFKDIMELRRLNETLKTRNEELDAFAHTVAYDLQTPLNSIIDQAKILKENYTTLPREEWQAFLQAIIRNGRKMSNIIEALLLLAGVRNSRVELEPLDMASILIEVQERLTPMINEYEAEIILPESWPLTIGYGPWVEEVWTNYLSNAIQYGGRPPRVEAGAAAQSDGFVRFWVQDNGPGLTPAEQAELFIPFIRLDQVRTKGHGLGLSIVRRIIEKLGGQVWVESEGKIGQGSQFNFTLPGLRQWETG